MSEGNYENKIKKQRETEWQLQKVSDFLSEEYKNKKI